MLLNITCHLHLRDSFSDIAKVMFPERHKMYYNAGYKDASYKMR